MFKTKTIKGNYGEVRFIDCMEGLKQLKDKEFDLCLTDPKYNVKWTCSTDNRKDSTIPYDDYMPQDKYMDWCKEWFLLMEQKVERFAFTCGNHNFRDWLLFRDFSYINWIDKSKQGAIKGAYLSKFEPILHNTMFKLGIIELNHNKERNEGFVHTCPKPFALYEKIILELKPKSVLDIFAGTGTTGEVCEKYGIPWLSFELKEDYAPDIEMRIKRGMLKTNLKKTKQTYLV